MKAEHLFTGCDGDLYDTRQKDWYSKRPLRAVFKKTFAEITNTRELKATLRAGAFAWPGGYPLYFVTSDGGALSFQTVREELPSVLDSIRENNSDGWQVIGCDVNWENTSLF